VECIDCRAIQCSELKKYIQEFEEDVENLIHVNSFHGLHTECGTKEGVLQNSK
jgi:hypothetical protein